MGIADLIRGAAASSPAPDAGAVTSRGWRVTFADRPPLIVWSIPPATRREVENIYTMALSVEAFEQPGPMPSAPMTAQEESTIRAWLASIGEDAATTTEVIDRCQKDAAARAGFLRDAGYDDFSPSQAV